MFTHKKEKLPVNFKTTKQPMIHKKNPLVKPKTNAQTHTTTNISNIKEG